MTVFICRLLTIQGLPAAKIITVLWIGAYLALYVICLKLPVSILLFVLLTILNYGSFKAIIVNGLTHFLPFPSAERYSLLSSILLLFVYLFTFPFMYQMMTKKIGPLINEADNNRYWRFLWLVPATFCLSYYYNLYANGGIMAFSAKNSNVIFALLFNLGALFVTFLILQLLKECNDKLLLEEENHHLAMQSIRYENLNCRIEEARIARHDLRQHLSVMQSFLQSKDYQKLSDYIHEYISTLPSDSTITYCEDYALNALIVYYENMAKNHQIRFLADIDYPPENKILSSDAVILFGNLLENALEACMRESVPDPFISLCIKPMNSMIIVALDNTCTQLPERCKDGFASAKKSRTGIGTVSISKIAEKYNGAAQFEFKNGVFYSSVLLSP
ncbi:MAG: GHKL domain-containing protein [Lachnospiraceae bacterium]|nr:GHKL domain-containing protein [Lachnospiraceae bacterium]